MLRNVEMAIDGYWNGPKVSTIRCGARMSVSCQCQNATSATNNATRHRCQERLRYPERETQSSWSTNKGEVKVTFTQKTTEKQH